MIHGFSDEEWTSYLDGDAQHEDRLEAHLIGCQSCWEFNERMSKTEIRLRETGASARLSFPLQDASLHRSLSNVLARIHAESALTSGQAREVRERLDTLKHVLAPMCGSTTAVRALRAAAKGSPARSLERLNEDNWSSFLTSLKSIAVVMCGETGAHLVWESGQF